MHRDESHGAYTHYGIRNQKYKLIFWYNIGFDLPGTMIAANEVQEWKYFDCKKDPLELPNVYYAPQYAGVAKELTKESSANITEIGDIFRYEHAAGRQHLTNSRPRSLQQELA